MFIGDAIKRHFLVKLVTFKVFFQPNNHMNVFVFGIRWKVYSWRFIFTNKNYYLYVWIFCNSTKRKKCRFLWFYSIFSGFYHFFLNFDPVYTPKTFMVALFKFKGLLRVIKGVCRGGLEGGSGTSPFSYGCAPVFTCILPVTLQKWTIFFNQGP